jgi:hypothetical protein
MNSTARPITPQVLAEGAHASRRWRNGSREIWCRLRATFITPARPPVMYAACIGDRT